MKNSINIKVADFAVSKAPDVIVTFGIGSCVAICLYDRETKYGAMAHVMLPTAGKRVMAQDNPFRFVDTALPLMVDALIKKGVNYKKLEAKIVGGAHMFSVLGSGEMEIGKRNVTIVETMLQSLNIKLDSEDVGGNVGRNVEFDLDSGVVNVSTRM